MCRKSWQKDHPLSVTVQTDMTTFSEGLSNVLIVEVPCLQRWRTKESAIRTVHEVVLADIQRHAGQALADRKAMVTEIAERLNVQLSADREQQKKELRQYKQRVSEIENLYAKLYEDMTRKLITEKRFQMLSARYDSEQEELSAKIKELEKSATADREQLSSIEQFAEQISGYAGITELNYKIVHQLIDKILISEPVEINGEKIQRLTIHYKFIGALETLE